MEVRVFCLGCLSPRESATGSLSVGDRADPRNTFHMMTEGEISAFSRN